jgi:hypothetical protein
VQGRKAARRLRQREVTTSVQRAQLGSVVEATSGMHTWNRQLVGFRKLDHPVASQSRDEARARAVYELRLGGAAERVHHTRNF